MKQCSDITIIVVTYNSAHIIGDMILGLPRDYGVIVVDNHSNDGTCEIVENIDRDNVLLLRNLRNVGYGAGNNVGLRACKTRYALVMNPDAMIVGDDVEKLRQALESDERAVLAGPRINGRDCYEPDYLFDRSEPLFRTPFNCGIENKAIISDFSRSYISGFVSGAIFLYDLEKMSDVIYFDENMVLYFEEFEICYRMKQAGYHALFVSYAIASHVASSSSIFTSTGETHWFPKYHWGYSLGYLSCKYRDKVPIFDSWWYVMNLRFRAFLSRYTGKKLYRIMSYHARLEGFEDALRKFG